MVNTYSSNSFEKVTFNIPSELKEQVMALKDELKVSLSSIYNEAIANYLKQKELGLESLEEALQTHKNELKKELGGIPTDIAERKKSERAWMKSVGWG
jgi:predicted transcriptional regulator